MTRHSSSVLTAPSGRVLSQIDTIEWLLKRSKRHNETVPLRRAFVQIAEEDPRLKTRPGPLHQLMRNERAFDLLLLVHAVTAGGDFGVIERSETWGRASGVSFRTDGSASVAVSRLWRRLEKLNLIERSFDGRLAKITKLLEDGSGKPYAKPGGSPTGPRRDVYFQLPYQYWRDNLHNELDMPGKAVMLIGMSQRQPRFALPKTSTYAGYYGISEITLRRGIQQLQDVGVLEQVDSEEFITGETRTGWGVRALYAFNPPYDRNVKAEPQDDTDEVSAETASGDTSAAPSQPT